MTTRPTATHRISDTALDIDGSPSIFRGCLATMTEINGGRMAQHVALAHIELGEALRREKALAAAERERHPDVHFWAPSTLDHVRERYGADEAGGLLQYWCMERDLVPLDGAAS
jgi:hypothetical protein